MNECGGLPGQREPNTQLLGIVGGNEKPSARSGRLFFPGVWFIPGVFCMYVVFDPSDARSLELQCSFAGRVCATRLPPPPRGVEFALVCDYRPMLMVLG